MDRPRRTRRPGRRATAASTVALTLALLLLGSRCTLSVSGPGVGTPTPVTSATPTPPAPPPSATGVRHLAPGECKPGAPLAGVYLSFRLTVKNPCTTVTGTVDCIRPEPDGDIHVLLRPDPVDRSVLTPANAVQSCAGHPDPHLVVEIIPRNSAEIGGFATPDAPAAGAHVSVTGPLVWDTNVLHELVHPGKLVKNWAEIHPAWNITTDRQSG